MIAGPPVRTLTCSACDTVFACGEGGTGGDCWCVDLPVKRLPAATAGADCLCPACLKAAPDHSADTKAP